MEQTRSHQSQYASSLIEASLDPLITISKEGKIMDINRAMVDITGIERKNLIGSNFDNYFTEPQKAQKIYQEVFANGSGGNLPLTFCHQNGKLTDVLFNGSVYRDKDKNVLGAVMVARDIAEQKWAKELQIANKELILQNKETEKRTAELIIANKKLAFQNKEKKKRAKELIRAEIELDYQSEEKEKRSAENKALEAFSYSLKLASKYSLSLIEASRDPLVVISPMGKITDMNEALVNITGVSRDKLKQTDFLDYFTEPHKAHLVYQEVFAKESVADSPLTLRQANGKLTDVLFNGSVYKDDLGNVLGAVIVARDSTEQKRVANELTEAIVFAELAVDIAEDAKLKAEHATRIAENAVKAKQQFLSNMSHEIRTPMNAIIGFTKVLLKTEMTAKQKEYLAAIKLSGDALIVLINDILDLAKVDAGKMTFEQTPFKIAASVSAMLHLFETKIHEKNLSLVMEYDQNIPEVLVGDPVRLHQIISNLVGNAVKFTNKGKITVDISLRIEDEKTATIQFSVTDTGIGIAEEKLEKIFENFQQATSGTSRIYGGTGLGLAIVKQLVESQRGTVTVESTVNQGSTFSFTLNFLKTSEDAELDSAVIELDSELENINILVVEDIVLNQLLMRTLLDDFGFKLDIAENGKIAIEKLRAKTYDLILMDLQMPEMNGFDATDYIRNTMKLQIPIIALTADVTTVDLAKCKAVGMDDYIAKPVDDSLLYSKIVAFVKKTAPKNLSESQTKIIDEVIVNSCINLEYLNGRTKSHPKLMMEMISAYLEQTPSLISNMKKGLVDKDWNLLYASAHKMTPSFSIMGMGVEPENLAKRVQEYANTQQQTGEISELVGQLETVCTQACNELRVEFNRIRNTTS